MLVMIFWLDKHCGVSATEILNLNLSYILELWLVWIQILQKTALSLVMTTDREKGGDSSPLFFCLLAFFCLYVV